MTEGEGKQEPQGPAQTPQPPAQTVEIAAGSEPQNPLAHSGSSLREPRLPRLFALRGDLATFPALLWGLLALSLIFGLWWYLTAGLPEERIMGRNVLPSPSETFARERLHELWFDRALTRNTWASLRRVIFGFGLAAIIGIPVGVLCGCFSWINAFFTPLMIFGRNIPIAALIPITYAFFGIAEQQKIMFIFIACVAFITFDAARAIQEVNNRYIDTAYTLGASRRQIIFKVLVPLAMPGIFNSMRLLFGLAFGYIMLVELVTIGGQGGLGYIINTSQRLSQFEHILLILMIIPLIALGIDRLLFWMQQQLFPYQYGGAGLLHNLVRFGLRGWESLKGLFRKPVPLRSVQASPAPSSKTSAP